MNKLDRFHFLMKTNFLVPVNSKGEIDPYLQVMIRCKIKSQEAKNYLPMAVAFGFKQLLTREVVILTYANINLFFIREWDERSCKRKFLNVPFQN